MNARTDPARLKPARPARAPDVHLQPGEYFVGEGVRVRTLLGSCVSVTLWHPGRRVGAMCHFVLAQRGRRGNAALDARYGDEALALMFEELVQRQVALADCEAKIFGGGDMFPGQRAAAGGVSVGRRNGEAARSILEAQGVTVRSQHLYGFGHRQIIFDMDSGHVWVRHDKGAAAADAPARGGR